MFKNIINLIYLISLFSTLEFSLTLNVIAIISLALYPKFSRLYDPDDRYIAKNKMLAFVSLTFSAIFFTELDSFIGMDNAIVASILSLASLLGVIAFFYYTFLMMLCSFSEIKALTLR